MTARRNAWFLLAAATSLLLAACPEKDKEDDKEEDGDTKKAKTSETATTPPASTTPAPVTTETAPRPAGITPLVKAEVDNRADGIAGGQKVAVLAKAAIDVPAGWTLTKGETQVATSTDQKARVAITNFGPEGPEGKLAAAATAAGLTNCQWAPPEPVTAGKDKLPGQVADGLCSRGAGQVKAAFLASEGLLAVGSWDDGGDQANVFGSFRSLTKAAVGTDGVAACCAAIRGNMKSAPPQQIPFYTAAAGMCDSLKTNPQGRAMLGQVRAALAGAQVPASCK
jgi:hypothetical protein